MSLSRGFQTVKRMNDVLGRNVCALNWPVPRVFVNCRYRDATAMLRGGANG